MSPKEARDEIDIFNELQQLCNSPGYIHAIAYFCWRDNLIRFSGDKITEDDLQHTYAPDKLIRSEISTLIGLMVKGNLNTKLPEPATLQSYIDNSEALLHEMHMSLQKPWVEAFETATKSKKIRSPFSTAQGLREPIFYSGEAAYNFQYEEFSTLKYKADNDWLLKEFGFTIEEAALVACKLGELLESKIPKCQEAMLTTSPDLMTILPAFVFSAQDLTNITEYCIEKIERILMAFTVNLNNGNSTFTSLSAFNEINAAPIIKDTNGSYILLQHYSLLEALYEAPFFWMTSDKSYRSTASKNRGAYTEHIITNCLESVFGSKHVFQNVDIYKGKNRVTEADILVVYGDRAIIVQAKSKRLTIEARKGNDLQLKDDFKKAIIDAYDQALLCAKSLMDHECHFILPSNVEINFTQRPTKIFPVCCVSDYFPALAAQAREFLKTKTNDNIYPPIVTDVFFIDVLTEILETPLQLLNYLALRAKFDERILISQELVGLGYHLKQNLWIDDQYNMALLSEDLTSALDAAMLARRRGILGEKTPKGILTRFDKTPIGHLLAEIEVSASPELVGLGMLLLQLGSETATHINNGLKQIVQLAAHDRKQHDLSIPSDVEKSGLTFHVSPLPDKEAQEHLEIHCRVRKYITKSDNWYGITLTPGTGSIRFAIAIQEKWKIDMIMEEAVAKWTKKPMTPISQLSQAFTKRKFKRNDPCPCGSGKKYKKCHGR